MQEHQQDPNGFRPGDKVRIHSGPYTGSRGIIRSEEEGLIEVELTSGDRVQVALLEATNYSLAARRAWQIMPKNAGRPPLDPSTKKKMVSMRLDPDVLRLLSRAVENGFIPNREEAVNAWLRERLDDLLGKEPISGKMPEESQTQIGEDDAEDC